MPLAPSGHVEGWVHPIQAMKGMGYGFYHTLHEEWVSQGTSEKTSASPHTELGTKLPRVFGKPNRMALEGRVMSAFPWDWSLRNSSRGVRTMPLRTGGQAERRQADRRGDLSAF